ncbi:MAG: PKD-like domain-containing protein, partial [Candidatus Cyclobacteriaceae bacterium M3_2C_046]
SPYTIAIDNGVGTINGYTSGAAIPVSPGATTTYQLTSVTDANGCTSAVITGEAIVSVNTLPNLILSPTSQSICSGDAASINFSTTNSVSPVTYSWEVINNPGGVIGAGTGFGNQLNQVLINPGNSIQPVTYRVYSESGAGCNGETKDVSMTVYPKPSMSIDNLAQSICDGTATNIALNTPTENGLIRISGIDYAGGNVVGDGTLSIQDTVNSINEVLDNMTTSIQSVTYNFEVLSSDGCGPVGSFQTSVEVKPSVNIAITNNQPEICSGTGVSLDYETLTVNGTISLQAIYPAGVSGSVNYTTSKGLFVPSGTIDEVLTNTTSSNQTVTYTFTANGNGCSPVSEMYTVELAPRPKLTNLPSPTAVCSGTTLNFLPTSNVSDTQFDWNASITGNITGFTLTGSGSITDELINTGDNIEIVTYKVYTTGPGTTLCEGDSAEYIVQVAPTPKMTINNSTELICNNQTTNIQLLSPTPNAIIRLESVQYNGITGGNLIGGETFISGAIIKENLYNSTNEIVKVTYDFSISANGCSPVFFTDSVKVKPTPTINTNNTKQNICSEESTNITISTPTENGEITLVDVDYPFGITNGIYTDGQTFPSGSLNINETLINETNSKLTITYRFTSSANGCGPSIIYEEQVNVNPAPVLTVSDNGLNKFCSGTSTEILLMTDPSTEDISIELIDIKLSDASSISGNSSVGELFETGYTINDLLINNSNSQQSIEYVFRPILNGCIGIKDSISITVDPTPGIQAITPNASNPQYQLLCHQESTEITLSDPKGVTGTNFIWTISNGADAFGANSNPGTTESSISDSLYNQTPLLKNIQYYIKSESPAGCQSDEVRVSIDLNPELVVEAGVNTEICENSSFKLGGEPTALGGVGSYTYVWMGSDAFSSNLSNPLIEPVGPGQKMFKVFVTDANNCTSVTDSIQLDVTAQINVEVTSSDNFICFNENVRLFGEITGSETGGTWSTSGDGSFHESEHHSSVEFIAGDSVVYYPGLNDIINGSVTIILTSEDPEGDCGPEIIEKTIKISPALNVNAGNDVYQCQGEPVQLGGDTENPTASGGTGFYTIIWSGPNGFSSNAANPSVIPQSLGENIYTVQVIDDFGCISDESSMEVTVNQKATADAGTDFAVCETDLIELSGVVTGSASITGSWSVNEGFGTIINNQSVNGLVTAQYVVHPDDIGKFVFLQLTTNDPDGTGASGPCSIEMDELIVRINPLPQLEILNLPEEWAVNGENIDLFGNPTGGIFTGPGIESGSNLFRPAMAGDGIHTITYAYTSPNTGCFNQFAQDIKINPTPDVAIVGLEATFCFDDEEIALVAEPAGGLFTGPGIAFGQNLFRPRVAGVGTHDIKYTYTDQNNVTVEVSKTVQVFAAPRPNFSYDEANACVTDSLLFEDQSALPGQEVFNETLVSWTWNFGDGSTDTIPNPKHKFLADGNLSPGEKFINLEVTSNSGCSNSVTKLVNVGAIPTAKFQVEKIALRDTTQFSDRSESGNASFNRDIIDTYLWDFDHNGNTSTGQNPVYVYPEIGAYDVSLAIRTVFGCEDDTTITVNILPLVDQFPYVQSFDQGISGWVAGGDSSSWELGPPDGQVINNAYSGSSVWMTNLDGVYRKNERSWVNGPAFDLTQIERPMLSVKLWYQTQQQVDGAVIQYSLDGGISWERLGDLNQDDAGIDWYNTTSIVSQPGEFEAGDVNLGSLGWTGKTSEWVDARYSLEFLTNESQVRFRFAFASDGTDLQDLDGFAFDDFTIKSRERLVLAEHFINAPLSGNDNEAFYSLVRNVNPPFAGSLKNQVPREVTTLQYHINVPSNNPLYQDNTADPSARLEYYNYDEHLKTRIDGTENYNIGGNTESINVANLVTATLYDPQFKIGVEDVTPDDSTLITFNGYIKSLADFSNQRIALHLAVIEREVSPRDAGISISNTLKDVLKKMVPNAAGTEYNRDWTTNDSISFNISWDLSETPVKIYDPTQLAVLVFVQNIETKEIYQTKYLKLQPKKAVLTTGFETEKVYYPELKNLALYPQPANNQINVQFEQPLNEDFEYKIIDLRGVTIATGVFTQGVDAFKIDVNRVPMGLNYILIGQNQKGFIYRKFVIAR